MKSCLDENTFFSTNSYNSEINEINETNINKVHYMKLTETKKLLLGHIAQISQKGSFLKAKFARVTVKRREERVGVLHRRGRLFCEPASPSLKPQAACLFLRASKDSRQKIQKQA